MQHNATVYKSLPMSIIPDGTLKARSPLHLKRTTFQQRSLVLHTLVVHIETGLGDR